MWLPKEERDLLIFYFRKIKDTKNGRTFTDPFELIDAIGYIPTFRRVLRYLKLWLDYKILRSLKRLFHVKISNVIPPANDSRFDKASAANERLHQRGLIALKEDLMVTHVKQTLQGWDLGRKYSNILIRLGLWFAEYKDCGLGAGNWCHFRDSGNHNRQQTFAVMSECSKSIFLCAFGSE